VHRHHFDSHTALAAVLALASALAFAVAIVAQQRAAALVSDSDARSGRLFLRLVRSRQWLAGTASNTAGFGLQAAALAYGSLLVVQPLLVTSLLFALPLGARLAHERLPRSVGVWSALLAISLAVFVITGHPNHGADHGSRSGWVIVAAILGPLVIAGLVVGERTVGAARASLLAIVVGVLGGVLAVLTKAVVSTLRHRAGHVLTSWELYAFLAVGIAGVYLQQLSFQAGALQASWPIITVLEPVVAAGIGLTLLHEKLRIGGLTELVLAVSVIAMTVATVALARDQALLDQHVAD
jgi:drug/metabolite transporter (DMT)-like permease